MIRQSIPHQMPTHALSRRRRLGPVLAAVALAATVAACDATRETNAPTLGPDGELGWDNQGSSVFGPGGLTLFGGNQDGQDAASGAGLNVNAFLWRASLDTTSFMPLASADPFGGVIISDWHSPSATPGERFKVNVFILGRQLRADAVRASVFRQVRDASGAWVDARVADDVATDLENAILTRARELRIATSGR